MRAGWRGAACSADPTVKTKQPCREKRLFERHARLLLGGADGQRGLDARDVGRGRQLAGQEFLEALQVLADDLQDEVDLAVEHVALTHFGQPAHVLLERLQVFLGLAFQADHREHHDRVAELRRVEIGMIAADHAVFLERAHPPEARRRGQPDALRQLDVGHPALGLQLSQQAPVDRIQIRHQTKSPAPARSHSCPTTAISSTYRCAPQQYYYTPDYYPPLGMSRFATRGARTFHPGAKLVGPYWRNRGFSRYLPSSGDSMQFDDRLATVRRMQADSERAAGTQYRQLRDLLGSAPGGADDALLQRAYTRVEALSGAIPAERRAALIREPGMRMRNPELIAFLAAQESAIAAAAMASARLSAVQWEDAIPSLSLTSRELLRHRDDLPGATDELLARLGVRSLGLPEPNGAASRAASPAR